MFFLLPALASVASAGAGLAGAAATTAAAAATSSGVGTLAAAAGAGYALGSACGGGSHRPREEQGSGIGVSREELRRELEAAYAKGYEEARRAVMDELKAIEYERGRKVAQRQQKGGELNGFKRSSCVLRQFTYEESRIEVVK